MIDIEALDNLPFRETTKYRSRYCYKYKHRESHKVDGIYPWTRVRRILEANIGKSFDLAFSYYCTLVPKYQQKYFLEEFETKYWRAGGSSYGYYVDEQGNIQENKYIKPKQPICLTFGNYKTELRHKVTGHPRKHFEDLCDLIELTSIKGCWNYITKRNKHTGKYQYFKRGRYIGLKYIGKFDVPLHESYIAQEKDFEKVIISGSIQYFESKNDPRYVRHWAELEQSRKSKFKNEKEERRKRIELGLLSRFSISKSAKKELKKKMEAERKEKEKLAKLEMLEILQRKGFRPNAFTNKINDAT